MLYCSFPSCFEVLAYVHGSAVCLRVCCPLFMVKQVECCSGEVGCGGVC